MRRSSLHLLRLTLLTALTGCPLPEKPDDSGDTSDPMSLCADGESILLAGGDPSGFERCADGAINRLTAGAFDPTVDLPSCRGDELSRSCETDAECTDAPYGKCVSGEAFDYYSYEPYDYCGCAYGCSADGDCQTGEACIPAEVSGLAYAQCLPATCGTNDDCATGECGYSEFDDGCGVSRSLDCRGPADTCHGDADCADNETCWSDYDGVWTCEEGGCAIGRPLLVDGAARVAEPAARADWAEAPEVALPLDGETRAALAAYWAHVGALEHASVASFARFTLQLLSLGAPSDLVADAQTAAADEVRHARLAYGLASRYGGAPVGPGPLALADAAPGLDARSVMHALVSEACIGETLGAAELYAAADTCVEPRLAAALRATAEEEARHAALAWRALRWLLERSPELRDEALAAIGARLAGLDALPAATPHVPAHGVLGAEARRAVYQAAVAGVVDECIAACISRSAA